MLFQTTEFLWSLDFLSKGYEYPWSSLLSKGSEIKRNRRKTETAHSIFHLTYITHGN